MAKCISPSVSLFLTKFNPHRLLSPGCPENHHVASTSSAAVERLTTNRSPGNTVANFATVFAKRTGKMKFPPSTKCTRPTLAILKNCISSYLPAFHSGLVVPAIAFFRESAAHARPTDNGERRAAEEGSRDQRAGADRIRGERATVSRSI